MNKLISWLRVYSKPLIINYLFPFVLFELTNEELNTIQHEIEYERKRREWDLEVQTEDPEDK